MKYLILTASVNQPATHISPTGNSVHVKEFADGITINSPVMILTSLSGYVPLSELQTKQFVAVAKATDQYNRAVAKGTTVTDPTNLSARITLASADGDRNNFTQLLAHLTNAGTADTESITIADLTGTLHTMTVKQFKKLMIAYGHAYYAMWTALQQQIATAGSTV